MCIRDSFVRTWVFQAFKIPSGSMEPNLLIGDHLIVNKMEFAPTATALERAPVSYTHLRAHETVLDLVCRLLLEKKK